MSSFTEIGRKIIRGDKTSSLEKIQGMTELGLIVGALKFAIEGGLIALLSTVTTFGIAFLGGGVVGVGAFLGLKEANKRIKIAQAKRVIEEAKESK